MHYSAYFMIFIIIIHRLLAKKMQYRKQCHVIIYNRTVTKRMEKKIQAINGNANM